MRKILFGLFGFLAVVVISYLFACLLLDAGTRHVIARYSSDLEIPGMEIYQPHFKTIRPTAYNEITATECSSFLRIKAPDRFSSDLGFLVEAHQVRVRLENFQEPQLSCEIHNLAINARPVGNHASRQLIKGGSYLYGRSLTLRIIPNSLRPGDLRRALSVIPQNLSALIREGQCPMDFEFSGTLYTRILGEPLELPLESRRSSGLTTLVTSANLFDKVSHGFREELTETEQRLLSLNPLRANRLLAIKNEAEATSRKAFKENSGVPEDAYRHLLWSYLLSRAFGPVFAKEVTDAHEIGCIKRNTPEDHAMDYHNNALGRMLAADRLSATRILLIAKNDPRVIRRASEASSRNDLLS
ncbi:MAG: hypothetical protein HQL11_00955 [Candidatus Omnitrophica bacterium]|nr:hypothetical protein [Candidatus Omnitrophota bacterium]